MATDLDAMVRFVDAKRRYAEILALLEQADQRFEELRFVLQQLDAEEERAFAALLADKTQTRASLRAFNQAYYARLVATDFGDR